MNQALSGGPLKRLAGTVPDTPVRVHWQTAPLAQLAERDTCNIDVIGSIPVGGSVVKWSMKDPHSPAGLEDIDFELEKLEAYAVDQVRRAEQLGEDRQRVEFFEKLRELIGEKDAAGDSVAVEVISWVYERLSE